MILTILKAVGIETEYGINIHPSPEQAVIRLSQQLLDVCYLELTGELLDPLANPLLAGKFAPPLYGSDLAFQQNSVPTDEGPSRQPQTSLRSHTMLSNGSRLYVDHFHPEYCTAECLSPYDLVAHDKAGELILSRALATLNATLNSQQTVSLYKNNIDYKGRCYGCHENYLLEVQTYKKLIYTDRTYTIERLIPFLVTRQIFAGSGRIGSDNNKATSYQMSQRADFFDHLFSAETMFRRPIINTRDEPHGESERIRRLHVIVGDANPSEFATFLKVGTLQLLLQMIEDGVDLPSLPLSNPCRAIQAVSRDLTCRIGIGMSGKRRKRSPLDIQWSYLEAAQSYVARNPSPMSERIVAAWDDVLTKLRQDPNLLARQVDWVTKLQLLETLQRRIGADLQDPRLKEADLKYHSIGPDSLYSAMKRKGLVERLVTDEEIEHFVHHAPADTRASARSQYLKRLGKAVSDADWSAVMVKLVDGSVMQIMMPDPLEHRALFFNTSTWRQFSAIIHVPDNEKTPAVSCEGKTCIPDSSV